MNDLLKSLNARIRPQRGNVMVYLVVLMLIFGVLGVVMVSLFSTSVTSSATRNDNRRAAYLSEAGIRYAKSEMWARDFSKSVIEELNDTNKEYTLKDPAGSFKLNVFSPWFETASAINLLTGSTTETLDIPEGRLPDGFTDAVPTTPPFLTLVNYDYIDLSPTGTSRPNPEDSGRAKVVNSAAVSGDPTKLQLEIRDDGESQGFVAGKGEALCLAVHPAADQAISSFPASLNVELAAAGVFPEHGGAFEIHRNNFFYERATVKGSYVELAGIRPVAVSGTPPSTIDARTTDYVIFSPRNRLVIAKGKSGDVTFGDSMNYASAVADTSIVAPGEKGPDWSIDDPPILDSVFSQVVAPESPNFISIDNTDRFIRFSGPGFALGALWFKDTRNIGGQREFCTAAQGCRFNQGIRVFFTLEYSGTGDGLIFALINGSGGNNDPSSIGGDRERSEMLGYAGDSRLDVAGTLFADNYGPRGIFPPKIGLEFDTKVNYHGNFESTAKNYCSSASNLVASTRNDPGSTSSTPVQGPASKDAVQYVFWGNSSLSAACRENKPSYDDNRHDAEGLSTDWSLSAGSNIGTSPAIGPDGIVYVGSSNNFMSAVDPRSPGSWKWRFSPGAKPTSALVAGSGPDYAIYFGAANGLFHALNPQGNSKAGFPFATNPSAELTTRPAVDEDGTVYFAAVDVVGAGLIDGYVYAVRPNGNLKSDWQGPGLENPRRIPFSFLTAPALSPDGSTLYVAATDTHTVYALRTSDGTERWSQQTPGVAFSTGVSVSVRDNGWVYIGDSAGFLYAMDPDQAGNKIVWSRDLTAGASAVSSAAAFGPDGTVYVGTFDDYLHAVNPATGAPKTGWPYYAAGNVQSTPLVDGTGAVYFGSDIRNFAADRNNVYALYPDGTERWRFQTGGDVRGTPAISAEGTVYAGSFDFNLYAINQFAGPKNEKDRRITTPSGSTTSITGKRPEGSPEVTETVLVGSESDWLKGAMTKGPWAVRLEVERSIAASADGTYGYTLKTWMRQCNQDNCVGTDDPIGSFYEDTRIGYSPAAHPPMMVQTIKISSQEHLDFTRFIWGFTSQTAAGEEQTATIRKFQLSFIRPNDPVVTADPDWP
jgi:outer membrane protein assembly factor BamB